MAAQRTINPEKRDAFLKELTELTLKHGIKIGGCGCCGSPWIAEAKPEDAECIYTVDYADQELGLVTVAHAEEWAWLNKERADENWPDGQ